METSNKDFNRIKDNQIWNGVALIIAGGLLLAYKLGADIPHWVWTWQMLLIVLGLLMGIKSRFRNVGAYVMIAIGGLFLADEFEPGLSMHRFILPVILIGVGIMFIFRPKYHLRKGHYDEVLKLRQNASQTFNKEYSSQYDTYTSKDDNYTNTHEDAEFVDYNAVFGGVKKNILSKNFRGGEINCFMGGAELNLIQADIQGAVVMELHNVFGGTKLIVPGNWDVKSELTAVFGGVEDKRDLATLTPDKTKILILKGVCLFGGIEIRNYG